MFLALADARMHYIDQGSGPPILFVHGNPTWSFYFRRLIAGLSHTHRAVAVDHIGCGLSDKPADYEYCLDRHIGNLVTLIDELDLSGTTLVAHDWGGAIGMGALLARRNRFQRIVLLNTGAFPPPFIPWRIRVCRWPIAGRWAVQGLNVFCRAALRMATTQPGGLPDPIAAGLLAPYDSWNNRIAIFRFVCDIPTSPRQQTWQTLAEIENQLPFLATWPIQLIWGMKDWCFRPECLERFLGHWPNASVARLANAGHYVLEDAADEVLAIIGEFLSKT
jgi:haloalkane dehalogenase